MKSSETYSLWRLIVILLSLAHCSVRAADRPETTGVSISYQLPVDGPLPQTYRVTLAIVDPKNPDWIVSQFACGAARTVTAENQGRFTETWNGLDDNFMPVPPGQYGVKGIYMPAQQWAVDKQWHSITPRFAGAASPWMPSPEQLDKPEPFGGDPVGAPLADVAVGQNGVAVFYYQYLENGLNCPMVDLNKPLGYEQFIRAFNSGGAGGGSCAATDGQTVWAFSTDGGPKFVYRADGKPFGQAPGANRPNSYSPEGWVTAMAVWREKADSRPLLFVSQRGKIAHQLKKNYRESDTEFADIITVHDGENGKVLATLPLKRPQGLAVRGNTLFALHLEGEAFAISRAAIKDQQVGPWQRVTMVPASIQPGDLEIDSHDRLYLSDSRANKVYQLDKAGKVLRSFGRLDAQKPGAFDPQTLMSPGKLATWTDAQGQDRLLIVDNAGPNRVSEWNADGTFIRDFLSLQTKSNDGYGVDPEHPDHIYLPGHRGWLTRFKVDYTKNAWAVDAVWPMDESDPRSPHLDRAKLIRANGRIYLAGRRSYNVFRLDAEKCVLSAAIIRSRPQPGKQPTYGLWRDANGNGRVDDDEISPVEMPPGLLTYHGQNWLEDLSFVTVRQGGNDIWRLPTTGFDPRGNPILGKWQKLFSDPVLEARAAGKADAIHGGNELADNFPSDWAGADGSMEEGFYVQARGGKNFSANEGPQHKISRYVPDGKGGFAIKWRTGRTAMQRLAEPGEVYGAMRVVKPINGLLSVIDQSRCGVLLYTQDGLYVETIFPDAKHFPGKSAGIYTQPGEFFAGHVYANRDNGRIYMAMGKYTPTLYEMQGWSLTDNPVRALTTMQRSVDITAARIASPPEIALAVRGGAGSARIARFAPALGEVAMDGSLSGWESCEPVAFEASKDQRVEVRCLYKPDQILLRWHARFPAKFEARPLPSIERVFSHDHQADTVSFYIQGDAAASPGGARGGRAGDVRFIFGLFKKDQAVEPVVVGLYPQWPGPAKASPQTYRTPVNTVSFAHVGVVDGARLGHAIDSDGKGFVIVASIPRAAIPAMSQPMTGGFRTLVNFEATFGGRNKFWWANSDGSANRETYDEPSEAGLYPGSWAPAQFGDVKGGVIVRNWQILGPFGGPGAEKFRPDPNGKMPGTNRDWKQATREFCEAAKYPPDDKLDFGAVYSGEMIRGYWPDPRQIRWHGASIADLDTRVVLGDGGQVWYGATWVGVPQDTELDLNFQSHPQTTLRWFINDQPVKGLVFQPVPNESKRQAASAKVTLKKGWNLIHFRGYCVGYPKFRAGLVIDGSVEKLWTLQLTGTPPTK